MHVLVAGCGWLGTALARRLVERGHRVTGIRRDPARAAALGAMGVEPLALDLAAPGAAERLPAADAIVACQAAGADGVEAYRAAYVDANRALIAAAARAARALSSTRGRPASSASATAPTSTRRRRLPPRARRRRCSSRRRRSCAAGGGGAADVGRPPLRPVRPGPRWHRRSRARREARARAGRRRVDELLSLETTRSRSCSPRSSGGGGAVYHGSDAEPVRGARSWSGSRPGSRCRRRAPPGAAGPSRRIRSERTRDALGIALEYPSFREGLAPLLDAVP